MGAFSILEMLNEQTLHNTAKTEAYREIVLDIDSIAITRHNHYSMNGLEKLAGNILADGELQEPLVLGRVEGKYRLLSGHRRMAAARLLIEDGHEEFRKLPCRYKDMSEIWFRLQLILGNADNREKTDYDKMNEAQELKEILQQARTEGTLKIEKGKRLRDYVAAVLGESSGKIGQLDAISSNATEEVKEQMAAGRLGITAAYETSRLPEEQQNEVAAAVAAGEDIKSREIQAMVEEQKEKEEHLRKEQVSTELQQPVVSDSDTKTKEECEHARGLHALKMLEKYYIYINEGERQILEAMLEDCKRRKQEYAIDE